MKKLTLALLLLVFIFGQDAQAQRRGNKKAKSRPRSSMSAAAPSIDDASKSAEEKAMRPDILPKGFTPFIQPIKKEVEGKTKELGKVDWSSQYIEAKGESVLDPERFKNPAQAKAMATRGAVVVAQRNLLEIVKGVHVQGETTVEDMMTKRDLITTRVEGIVKGAQMIGSPVERDGIVEVTLRMPLYEPNGLAPAVYDSTPARPIVVDDSQMDPNAKPDTSMMRNGKVPERGLAFNLAGKIIDPALFPVVVDENNNVLLDMKQFYDPKKGSFPKILRTTKELMQAAGFKKGVEIIDVIDAENGTIKISNTQKSKIPWAKILDVAKKVGKFLLLLL